jgi:hypothetical protein
MVIRYLVLAPAKLVLEATGTWIEDPSECRMPKRVRTGGSRLPLMRCTPAWPERRRRTETRMGLLCAARPPMSAVQRVWCRCSSLQDAQQEDCSVRVGAIDDFTLYGKLQTGFQLEPVSWTDIWSVEPFNRDEIWDLPRLSWHTMASGHWHGMHGWALLQRAAAEPRAICLASTRVRSGVLSRCQHQKRTSGCASCPAALRPDMRAIAAARRRHQHVGECENAGREAMMTWLWQRCRTSLTRCGKM